MSNPESIFKSAVGLGLISVASILMVFTLKPLYKDTGINTALRAEVQRQKSKVKSNLLSPKLVSSLQKSGEKKLIILGKKRAFRIFNQSMLNLFPKHEVVKLLTFDFSLLTYQKKDASLCVEKMQQGLSISDLPLASQKLLIVEGINCLKSAPNIDVENSDKYQTLFATSETIINQTELEKEAIQELISNLNSIQADLESMSEYQGVNMVMDYLLGISIGMLILVICTIIIVSIQYNISWS